MWDCFVGTLGSLRHSILWGTLIQLAAILLNDSAVASLPRFPTASNGMIVFVADGNLWRVPRAGGTAQRLTSDPGEDIMPRYSPDGNWIAFTASYQGNVDVYVIPAIGGSARRLTFQSDIDGIDSGNGGRMGPNNMVVTWTPDSKNVVFLSRREAWNTWIAKLFTVPIAGGPPVALPLDSGGLLTYGPDGHSIAYNRIFSNFRTWKRYKGGLAQQVFIYDFVTEKLTQITHWEGTNTAPMWYGRTIYYLSDGDKHFRANIWAYDLDTKETRQVTHFSDYDIDSPSLGDNAITFQQGGKLFVLDLPSEALHALDVVVPDDGTRTQPRTVAAKDFIREFDMGFITGPGNDVDYALAPSGKRALFSARGDIFSVPVNDGPTRNLTNTPAADQDHPTWSPDGEWIAYTTDKTGEQQIALRPAIGGDEKILTNFPSGYFYGPVYSPNGKMLAFTDNEHGLWLLDVDGKKRASRIAKDEYFEIHDQSFSPDSKYLTYSLYRDPSRRGLWIYEIAAEHAVPISEELSDDWRPIFSPDGKYLYFLSERRENPISSDTEYGFATLNSSGIYVAPLKRHTASPVAPLSDEGKLETADNDTNRKSAAISSTDIDFDGLMSRAVSVPVSDGTIVSFDLRGTKIIYQTFPPQVVDEGNIPGQRPALHVFDIHSRKDSVVADGLSSYSLSADGKTALIKKDADYVIVKLSSAEGKDAGQKLKLDDMHTRIDPIAEWAELFDNAWRLQRDFFYSTAMNGVDRDAVHGSYRKLLPLAGSREDVNYLIGQMLGELGNSHTYVGGGDKGSTTNSVPTSVLGVDFALDTATGRYSVATIYRGDNSRPDYRSPLTEPGINVKEGDILLAINGTELIAPKTPYELMVGVKDNEPVILTVAAKPDGKLQNVVVRALKSDLSLREMAWIEHKRETVERLSGGRIAYIYLSDMKTLGMRQFIRQFYRQLDKQALIMDDRWNFGGNIDQMLLERLRRVQNRVDVNRQRTPDSRHNQFFPGPMICLINHYSLSDGDMFPYYFRQYGLGKLLGTRTWGGVRSYRGKWALKDGGYIVIPEWSVYGKESQWLMENHGVDPDVEVEDLPDELGADHDKQLETAVSLLMKEIAGKPVGLPPPPSPLPAYPPEGDVPGPAR